MNAPSTHLLSRSRRRLGALVTVAVSAGLLIPAAGSAAGATLSQSARSGSVRAAITYQQHGRSFSDERLRIWRAGKLVYSQPVLSKVYCHSSCWPGSADGGTTLRVLRLGPGHDPQVLLHLFTGGNDCCTIAQIFSYDAQHRTYAKTELNLMSAGIEVKQLDHDGSYRLLTEDSSFDAHFTDHAFSGMPIAIYGVWDGMLERVTMSYPKLVAADAAQWLSAYRTDGLRYDDSAGFLAAWAADEEELGLMDTIDPFLYQEASAGHITSALGASMSGEAFVVKLQSFLEAEGYVPMCGGG